MDESESAEAVRIFWFCEAPRMIAGCDYGQRTCRGEFDVRLAIQRNSTVQKEPRK
jgi:hypothetical protein